LDTRYLIKPHTRVLTIGCRPIYTTELHRVINDRQRTKRQRY